MAKPAWEKDAERFGRRFKFGEWESGLLVARSVSPGKGNVKALRSRAAATRKAIAGDFAAAAGVHVSTVTAYRRTWDAAADAGLVPASEDLQPGEDVDLPDPGLWTHYYNAGNPKGAAEAAATPVLSERWVKWFDHIGNAMIEGARLAEETDETGEELEGHAALARFVYDRLRERQTDAEWRELSESSSKEV
jgi:hypothetical protein